MTVSAGSTKPGPGRSTVDSGPLFPNGVSASARARALADQLVKQREYVGLTPQQVSRITKLHPRFVDAIEKGEFSRLPGAFLSKSFVRTYAQCVQMDVVQIMEQYGELSCTEAAVPDLEIAPELEAAARPRGTARIVCLGLSLVIACLGCFFAGRYWQQRHEHGSIAQQALRSARTQEYPQLPASSNISPEVVTSQNVSNTMTSSQDGMPPQEASVDRVGECEGDGFCIEINARQDAWISINADGRVIMRATLPAHARKRITAQRLVVIRAGNIGALDFSFNGVQLPSQGRYDEARTLSFGTAGLEQQSTATPVPVNN
jgi:hypothetical protein